ncbi:tellurite resistance TerB C-terminal domain-containing protein [Leptotrichia massiliensis]|uniref:tellurite resistance TerB C-terminal domain-containing protein n=1 Tax=Leptotrichia massiliensis TaxID=1852388 RepID=UPI0028D18699|nr:tellurite resistance TerB C-terminal domain-containing protein [Leptotrichia massiliensis]
MKNYISELIKEIFSEVNKILNYKNNEKEYLKNESYDLKKESFEKEIINSGITKKEDDFFSKENNIIDITNFKEEKIVYSEFKENEMKIINNWESKLGKIDDYYFSELKVPFLRKKILELYNKIFEISSIELKNRNRILIKEIEKFEKENYVFKGETFKDVFYGGIQIINSKYNGIKKNIRNYYYFQDFWNILQEEAREVVIDEINKYLEKLPRLNNEIIMYYNLTPNGLPYRYWDRDGKFRKEYNLSDLEERILEQTSFRQTKIWNNYEAKKQMILLYLDEWKIIEERVKTEEKLKKKSKKIINAILNLEDYGYFEYNEIEGLYAILKIVENKIRSFIPNYKILEVKKELESIKKFFPKSMSNELLENIENFKLSKEKIESIITYEIKNYPKDWKLKLGYIELFNEKKINLIIRFNNDENLEKIIKELQKKERNSDDKLFYLFLLNRNRELKKTEVKMLEKIISADRFQDYKKLLEKDNEITQKTYEELKLLKFQKKKKIDLNLEKVKVTKEKFVETVNILEEYLKEENEEADISKIYNEEQKDIVVENKEQEKIENFQDNKIKEVLKIIVETQKMKESDLKNYAKEKNMSLNAYIDFINKEVYDIVNDQVIILENNTVKIDEFYIDDIKEWLKENA